MNNKIIFFLIAFCNFLVNYAQSGKLFSADAELSSSLINQVYQDRNGIIWIATEDGLNRYDGSKFTIYKHDRQNPYSILNNYVRVIFEDNKGHLFVGFLNGLQIYNYATDAFTEIPLLFESGNKINAHVSSILERKDGNILIGTAGHGLFLVSTKGNNLSAIQNVQITSSYLIKFLYEDNEQNLWIVTDDKGLIRTNKNNRVKSFFLNNGIPTNNISVICQDKNGNLLAGSLNSGLYLYDKSSDSFVSVPYRDNHSLPVKTLFLNDKNQFFVGTDGNGIKIYDPLQKKISEINFNVATFDFSKSKAHSILEDKAGNTWIGIYQKGVMLLPSLTNKFNYIGYKSVMKNTIGSNCIMSIFQDHKGTLWVGTDNDGLYGLTPDGEQKVHFTQTGKSNSVPTTVMSIFEDSEYNLWLGSFLNGMTKFNRKTGECEYVKNLLDQNSNYTLPVYSFAEDEDKNLWIATMGPGLFSMNLKNNKIVRYTSVGGTEYRPDLNVIHNSWINCLLITRNQKLYFGTFDGLGCLDLKTKNFVSTYGTNRLLAGQVIYTIFEDHEGTIWIGTPDGLKYLDRKTNRVKSFTMEHGLPNNVICAIKEDKDYNLWISTNYGISKFNPKDHSFINYYASDGLQGNEFSKRAALIDNKGQFIFGGISGLTIFNPQEITGNAKKLDVRITDFYIHDKSVKKNMKSGSHIIIDTTVMDAKKFYLSHKDNSFSIEFSSMEFISPERITFMYSMNDENWISLRPGTNRVTFNNLSPGKYNFRVKGSDYKTHSDIKAITVNISPVWYFSIWAKISYSLIFISIIYLIVQQIRQRYRTRQKMLEHIHAKQIDEAKLQFFTNISHEIRTPISLIVSPLKRLLISDKDIERQKAYLTMYRNTERILLLINQLMDIRKIDKEQMFLKFQEIEIVEYINELTSIFEDQIQSKNIELHFHHELEHLRVWIDPKNFDKIIMNVLSNAFKFTPENGKIDIYLRIGQKNNEVNKLHEYFEITISDTGIGLNENEIERIFERFYQIPNTQSNFNEGAGIGLHLSRSLVELHHGNIKAENNVNGQGCSFIIHLPLGKEHLKPDEIAINKTIPVHFTGISPIITSDSEEMKIKSKSKKRVLIIDDDDEIRKYIKNELAGDYHIIECTNGKEAFQLILDKTPDLIISDIIMPEMDGITLCRKIKQNVNINHIPVILLTAKTDERDNIEGLDTGADAYMIKPFSIELLKKTVQNIIKNREILQNNFSGNQTQKDKIKNITLKSSDDKLMEKVMDIINNNIGNPQLNVEMISKKIGISRVHLFRKLKELTNQSTRDLIRNIRLQQAAALLSSKNLTIKEVAVATGFSNLTHFSNAFKELYGVPPTIYVETHLKSEK